MEFTEDLIRKVAKNARLELTDEEIKEFLPQLKEVLNSFSELEALDTEGVEPSYQPIKIKNRLREDIPKESRSQKDILKNTKHKKEGYFKGPKII